LLLATGDALARAGNSAEARDTFAAAADLARASGMREELARAALGYGGRFPWVRAGDDERLVRLLEEALTALGDQEPVLRVKLLARLAGALRDQPALEARSSLSREAVEIARDLDDPYTLGYALVSHFTATWGPDSDLVAIAEEVTRLAEEAGDAELALDACFLRRQAWLELGNGEQIALATAEHKALADELRQPQQQWYDAVMSSNWALFRGNFAEAKELAAEALRLGRRALESEARLSHHLTQFALCRALGGLAEVEESVRRWADEYPGYRCFPCLVALLECETGRANDARVSFEGLAADDFAALPQDAEWLFCLSVLTEVAAHIGDADRAATLHEALCPYAQLNAIESGEIPIGCVARYLGIAAATTQRWDQAKDHFEDALEINARMGARPWIAHTQHDYARMLIARDGPGNRARASQLLSNALDVYRELRMKPWVARATEELSRIA
jgi:tetratricopeptide (TPR) repeat protein